MNLFENLNQYKESKNIMFDKETGEVLFNQLKDYLVSKNLIGRNNTDYNWNPSKFNAENNEPDGDIYLKSGCTVLIYSYINEFTDNEYKVVIQYATDLDDEIIKDIKSIFDEYKSNNWKLCLQ